MKEKDIKELEEIEKMLQEKADKVTMMPYEERRARLAARLGLDGQPAEEPVLEPALATNNGSAGVGFWHRKSTLVVGIALLFCCIVLAIVLPFVLKRETKFLFGNLEYRLSTQEEFETELEKSKIDPVDFSSYEIRSYRLWFTSENVVKGWNIEYFDELNTCMVIMDFFDKSVVDIQVDDDFDKLHQQISVDNTTIQYYTQKNEETYNTIALASYKNATYRIQCVSAQEDVSGVFRDLFGSAQQGE